MSMQFLWLYTLHMDSSDPLHLTQYSHPSHLPVLTILHGVRQDSTGFYTDQALHSLSQDEMGFLSGWDSICVYVALHKERKEHEVYVLYLPQRHKVPGEKSQASLPLLTSDQPWEEGRCFLSKMHSLMTKQQKFLWITNP